MIDRAMPIAIHVPGGTPTVGAPAPYAELRDAAGAPVRLSALWSGASRGTALVFLRHFG